jgi:hypothetical protein
MDLGIQTVKRELKYCDYMVMHSQVQKLVLK